MENQEFLIQQWVSLRNEIEIHIQHQMITVWVILFVILGCLAVSRFERFGNAVVLAVIFGIFAPYAIARTDLLIHRAGGAVVQIEKQLGVQGWDSFYKPKLVWGKVLLVPLDVMAAMPIIFLFWYSNRQMWNLYQDDFYWLGAWVVFGLGVIFIPVATALAND